MALMWWLLGRWEPLLALSGAGLATTAILIEHGAFGALQQAEANISFSAVALVGLVIGALGTPIAVLFRTSEAKNAALVSAKDAQIAAIQTALERAGERLDQALLHDQAKQAATLDLVTGLVRTTETGMNRLTEAVEQNTRATEERSRQAASEHAQQTRILSDLLAGSTVLQAVRNRPAGRRQTTQGGE